MAAKRPQGGKDVASMGLCDCVLELQRAGSHYDRIILVSVRNEATAFESSMQEMWRSVLHRLRSAHSRGFTFVGFHVRFRVGEDAANRAKSLGGNLQSMKHGEVLAGPLYVSLIQGE